MTPDRQAAITAVAAALTRLPAPDWLDDTAIAAAAVDAAWPHLAGAPPGRELAL